MSIDKFDEKRLFYKWKIILEKYDHQGKYVPDDQPLQVHLLQEESSGDEEAEEQFSRSTQARAHYALSEKT